MASRATRAARGAKAQAAVPPFDSIRNEPVRIFPPQSIKPSAGHVNVLQVLQTIPAPVAVVAVLSTLYASPNHALAFANRLIGRTVFLRHEMDQRCAGHAACVFLFYDELKQCAFLLGLARPQVEWLQPSTFISAAMASPGGERPTERDDALASINEMDRQRLRMEALVYMSSNLVFVVRETATFGTTMLKHVRALAAEKHQVLAHMAATAKSSKRSDKGERGGGGGGSGGNPFVPSRCVPHVLFVVPAIDAVLQSTHKQLTSTKPRSATVAYCKTIETMLCSVLRSVRGGMVGSVRTRDVLTPTNLSKERRIFNVDPTHCVVIVSKRSVTSDGSIRDRMEQVLAQLDDNTDENDDDSAGEHGPERDEPDLDVLLQPLEEDDIGFPHAIQYMGRFVDLLFAHSAGTSSSSNNKDSARAELLSLSQWLRTFHSLHKNLQRMDQKNRQEAAAVSDTQQLMYQLDGLDVRS